MYFDVLYRHLSQKVQDFILQKKKEQERKKEKEIN